jgi:hypothetical protein
MVEFCAMVKKTKSWDYAFGIGKIRALEKFLIGREVFQEAAAAPLADALRLFAEADISLDGLLQVNNSRQLEVVLQQRIMNLKNLIRSLLLDERLFSLLEFDSLSQAKQLVKDLKSEFLNDYIMHMIDMHNIKTFLRLYVLKEPESSLNRHLAVEGFIKREFFQRYYAQDLFLFLTGLQYVHKRNELIDYAYFLEEPIKLLQKENSFIALEKAMYGFLMQILKSAKYLSFGPEPLIGYYLAKLNEINLIRMIILAKLNHFATETVKERLSPVYA